MPKPSITIYLYAEPRISNLRLPEIKTYLEEKLSVARIDLRPEIFSFVLRQRRSAEERRNFLEFFAKAWAEAKIRNLHSPENHSPPLAGEISYEQKRIEDSKSLFGLLYDGLRLSRFFWQFIPANERDFNHMHLIFTDQLVGAWDEQSGRYHARVAIFSFPSLLSSAGIVEAPARAPRYYLKRQAALSLSVEPALITGEDSSHFMVHDDPRLTEVMKGYVMQAVAYHLLGEPFCSDKNCRLFNAHWQSELLQAQLSAGYEFCPRHQRWLEEIAEAGSKEQGAEEIKNEKCKVQNDR